MTKEPTTKPTDLAVYLDTRSTKARWHGWINDSLATACYVIAILSSFVAVSPLAKNIFGESALFLAGVPGLALLSSSVFAFEKKCFWHRSRRRAYRNFWMRLVYENESVESVSKAMREFEDTVAADYPRFGKITEKQP